jgi:Flp pilus assembly protein TadD
MDQKVKAQKLLFQANQQFIRGNITKTWELVDQAKRLDPAHYRIKTMEGSLLYRMGSKDLAFDRWGESLKQNPDQPELLAIMKEAKRKETVR